MARCIHCLDHLSPDLVAIGVRTCGRCAVLLQELGDTTVIACERGAAPKPRQRTGRWLVWAANKRGRLRDAQALGRERGFPRDMSQWSAGMVAIVVEALQRPTTPR